MMLTRLRLPVLAAAILMVLALSACAQQPATAPILPDSKLTPGDTLDVTLADIQVRGYSAKVRDVPVAVKRQVYASYGIQHWEKGEYEVDHLISLSLGGSNSTRNLWPQSYLTEPWNAHTKDQLEYKLLQLVRSGQVDLHTAQQEMAKNWIAAYKKYVSPIPLATGHRGERHPRGTAHEYQDQPAFSDEQPDNETSTVSATAAPPPHTATAPIVTDSGQVWVNTKSGVIWRPGSEFYGKTKVGRYMSAADALEAGFHYAR